MAGIALMVSQHVIPFQEEEFELVLVESIKVMGVGLLFDDAYLWLCAPVDRGVNPTFKGRRFLWRTFGEVIPEGAEYVGSIDNLGRFWHLFEIF